MLTIGLPVFGNEMTLYVKNCGTITATTKAIQASESGCQVLLPANTSLAVRSFILVV
jgi:hypothetical protein